MADSKISALPASTTPLAGTEVLPIVQSGATKQVSVANLTAGRAISATQLTLTAGNVIPANGYGIDFSATSGSGTSELLADYEEGTWTPVFNPGAGSITTQTCSGTYTKIGRVVVAQFSIVINNVGTGVGVSSVSGLPFTSANTADTGSGSVREYNLTGLEWNFTVNPNATTIYPARYDNINAIATNVGWRGAVTYTV